MTASQSTDFVCGHCFIDFSDKDSLIKHHQKVVKNSEQRKKYRMRKKLIQEDSLIDVNSFMRRIKPKPIQWGTEPEEIRSKIMAAMKDGIPSGVQFDYEHNGGGTEVRVTFSLYMPEVSQ